MPKIDSTNPNSLIRSGIDAREEVEKSVSKRVQKRFGEHYTAGEIDHISNLDSSMFPPGFELDETTSNTFRSLARLSHCALKPAHLRSHRKIIGPIIVAIKKLIWKLVKVHLEPAFDGLQEFCSWMVYSQAKQVAEIDRIRKHSANQ
jgi:hypothetical protein